MTNKKNSKVVSAATLIASLLFVIYFIYRYSNSFIPLLDAKIGLVFVVGLLMVVTLGLNGLKNKYLLRSFKIDLPKQEWFGLSAINTFWNYLPFQGGLLAKGAYLKKKYQFPYTQYVSLLGVSYLVTFFIFGLFGLGSSLIYYLFQGNYSLIAILIYVALTVSPIIVIIIFRSGQRIFKHPLMQKIFDGFEILTKHKATIFRIVAIDVILILTFSARLYFSGVAMDFSISWLFYFLVAPISLLSIFVTITPGGLIIREAIIAAFAGFLAVGVSDLVTIAALDRAISIIVIFSFGGIFNYYLTKKVLSTEYHG